MHLCVPEGEGMEKVSENEFFPGHGMNPASRVLLGLSVCSFPPAWSPPAPHSAMMCSFHLCLQIGKKDIILRRLGIKVSGQKEPQESLSPLTPTCPD